MPRNLFIELVKFKLTSRLVFIIPYCPDIPGIYKEAPLNFQNNRVRYSMLASSLMSPDWFMKLLSPGKEPGPKSRTDHPRTLLAPPEK